ncbi:MAG TPA: Lsr2 family protein [Acidothermaceae bacterium]
MAQKVQVTLVDDIDGSSADETLTFGIDGVFYEIDLSKSNAKKFRESLNAYVGAARRSGRSSRVGRPRGRAGRSKAAAGSAAPTSEIRAWARSKGIKVNERGRIAADIVARYESSH